MAYLGEEIPKLGFGLMRLPKLEDGGTDIEQVKQMVDMFMDAGLTYFDTARAYGDSEEVIRQALVERYPRESYQLATKNAAWLGAKDAAEAKGYFDKSLETTGAGYFDYYLLHNIGQFRTRYFDEWGMWDFAKQLKADGKVKHIGISYHDTADALEPVLDAHPEIEFIQLQINYADWEDGNVQSRRCYEIARAHGLPVIIMEPVKGGMLANPPQQVTDLLKAANPELTPVSWALRFVWGLEGLVTVLSGMSTIGQMEDNIAHWRAFEPLTASEQETLVQAQEKLHELIAVPCTACKYCMSGCPMEIHIPGVMECLNRAKLFGDSFGKGYYGFSTREGGKASDCTACGQCEEACPQMIDIVHQMEVEAEKFE